MDQNKSDKPSEYYRHAYDDKDNSVLTKAHILNEFSVPSQTAHGNTQLQAAIEGIKSVIEMDLISLWNGHYSRRKAEYAQYIKDGKLCLPVKDSKSKAPEKPAPKKKKDKHPKEAKPAPVAAPPAQAVPVSPAPK